MKDPKPKQIGRDVFISKLRSPFSRGLLRRKNQVDLVTRIHLIQKSIIDFIKEHRTVKIIHLFRNYSALIVVISSALLVSTTNFAAGKDSSGFLFGYFGGNSDQKEDVNSRLNMATKRENLAIVPLAQAKTELDTNQPVQEAEEISTVQGQALMADNSPVKKDPEEDGGVKIYEVKDGDTVSSIAHKNHISINTLLWANEIDNIDSIMPGDKIFILPITGLSYTVQKGDDIDSLAKKYKSKKEDIIAYNGLLANGELKEGDEIIIPNGEKELPNRNLAKNNPLVAPRSYETFTNPGKSTLGGKAGAGHKFPYGYCTWYVASKRYVPWSGNAGAWLYNARGAGYSTGKSPRPGAIIVTSESWWGHVGIVESVSGSSVTISEMNYKGWAKRSTRTLDSHSRVIKGYIY
jgi:surface antigen